MKLQEQGFLVAGTVMAHLSATDAFTFSFSSKCQSMPAFSRSPTHVYRDSRSSVHSRIMLEMKNSDMKQMPVETEKQSKSAVVMKVFDRLTDTMTPAGFVNEEQGGGIERPLVANFWGGGPKRFFFLLFTMLGIKWFRSKFLLKQKFSDKIPAWGHVITSKEQEEVLHAWTCKECGTTMFIAKGREIRFFNRFVECYNCGAKGKDSFYDRRKEIVENDDTDFEYENPMDYISKGERKKLEREQAMKTQMEQATDAEIVSTAVIEQTTEESVEVTDEPIVEEAAPIAEVEKSPDPEKKPPKKSKPESEDLDVLGMDF